MTDNFKALRDALKKPPWGTSLLIPAGQVATLLAEVDRQAAEIERLRAALEQIARMPHAPDAWIVAGIALESPEAARAALKEQPK